MLQKNRFVTKIVIFASNADRFLYNTNAPFAVTAVGVDAMPTEGYAYADFNHSQGDKIILRSLGQVQLATSVIVAGELHFMAQNSHQKAANFIKINAFLRRISLYGIGKETTEIYGDFKSEIIKQFGPKEKNKRKTTKLNTIGISENDLWIAATVLRHSLTLISSDSDFERMRQVREISLESWM